jgi:hypothetical protein
MNVFDYAETLWNHRFSHTFGVSGANYGTGSDSRAGLESTWGGAIAAGSRSVHASASPDRASASGVGRARQGSVHPRAMARARLRRADLYQACVRVQCGQPTEVVTSASNA